MSSIYTKNSRLSITFLLLIIIQIDLVKANDFSSKNESVFPRKIDVYFSVGCTFCIDLISRIGAGMNQLQEKDSVEVNFFHVPTALSRYKNVSKSDGLAAMSRLIYFSRYALCITNIQDKQLQPNQNVYVDFVSWVKNKLPNRQDLFSHTYDEASWQNWSYADGAKIFPKLKNSVHEENAILKMFADEYKPGSYSKCFDKSMSKQTLQAVKEKNEELKSLKIKNLPTFIIDGKRIESSTDAYRQIKELITLSSQK